MVSFIIALAILIIGYFTYGALIEKIVAPSSTAKTPAVVHPDGVDYVPMPTWKVFMIQFLNIAGVGPIFGAIIGAQFGTASFLWIAFGTILAGAMHDYVLGMMSVRHDGCNLPILHARYLGDKVRRFSDVFLILMLILVAVVFVSGPAKLLNELTDISLYFWVVVVFVYYIIATMLPIDKIIGRIYPVFAFALLFMAVGIMVVLLLRWPAEIPEAYNTLENMHPDGDPIFPVMFISIACGAISGFHATQSPLMARCMTNERQGRKIFYGAMVAEGVVALIWAAAAIYYYKVCGMSTPDASVVVNEISRDFLGTVGGVLAVLGVVAAPITSGDTALRSNRLIIAEAFHLSQKRIKNRLFVAIPLFAVTLGVLIYSFQDKDGFEMVWQYFGWSNQVLAAITLWTITIYLARKKKIYSLVSMIPAVFMTVVVVTFILMPPGVVEISKEIALLVGIIVAVIVLSRFLYKHIYKTSQVGKFEK